MIVIKVRPACCCHAWPKMRCPQHQAPHDLSGMSEVNHFADYAGATPQLKHKHDVELPTHGTFTVATGASTRIFGQWITKRYEFDQRLQGTLIRVIGQPDLDVNWRPVPGKPPPEGLVRRGPDWPFADEPMAVTA